MVRASGDSPSFVEGFDDRQSEIGAARPDGRRQLTFGGTDTIKTIYERAYPDAKIPGGAERFVVWLLSINDGRMPEPGQVFLMPAHEQMLDLAEPLMPKLGQEAAEIVKSEFTCTKNKNIRVTQHEEQKANQPKLAGAFGSQGSLGLGVSPRTAAGRGRKLTKVDAKTSAGTFFVAPKTIAAAISSDTDKVKEGDRAQADLISQLACFPPDAPAAVDLIAMTETLPEPPTPGRDLGIKLFGNVADGFVSLGVSAGVEAIAGSSADSVKALFSATRSTPSATGLLAAIEQKTNEAGDPDLLYEAASYAGDVLRFSIPGGILLGWIADTVTEEIRRRAPSQAQGASAQRMQRIVEHLWEHRDSYIIRLHQTPTAWKRVKDDFVLDSGLTLAMLTNVTPEQFTEAARLALSNRSPPVERASDIADALRANIMNYAGSAFLLTVRAEAKEKLNAAKASYKKILKGGNLEKLVKDLVDLTGKARALMFRRLGLEVSRAPEPESLRATLSDAVVQFDTMLAKLADTTKGSGELIEHVPWAAVAAAKRYGIRLKANGELAYAPEKRNLLEKALSARLKSDQFLVGAFNKVAAVATAAISGAATAGAVGQVSGFFGNAAADFALDVAMSAVPDVLEFVAILAQADNGPGV